MKHLIAVLAIAGMYSIPACASAGETVSSVETVARPRFAIEQDPWINLHFFAYHAARAQSGEKLMSRVPLLEADVAAFDEEARAAFAPLAAAYAPYLDKSPAFDPELAVIGQQLVDGPDALGDHELADALKAFMPVYQQRFWPLHQQLNEAMAAALDAGLATHGDALAAALARNLDSHWGDALIRVDLTPYTVRQGAFTIGDPSHIFLSTGDDDVLAYALEIMFHESSHTHPLGDTLLPAANAALGANGVENPRFWHLLLFMASGMSAKEVLGPDYVPYVWGTGIADRPEMKPYYEALLAVWDQHDTLEARATAAIAIVKANAN